MRVLVPVEDILFGAAISNFIVQHHWPEDTEFRIVHVVEPYLLQDGAQAPFSKLMELSRQQVIGSATCTIEEVADSIREVCPNLTVSRQVIEGPVKETITSLAEEWKADLIIAGAHGRSGFNRMVLGSVSLMLVQESGCPVLLIKPNADTLKIWGSVNTFASPAKIIKACKTVDSGKIMIALDNTELAQQMIDFVIEHNWTQPAQFKLLSVMRRPVWFELHSPELNEMYQDKVAVQEAQLRKLALKMRDHFHSPHIEEDLQEGDPRKIIVDAAEKWNADLIVLGSHYKPLAQRLVLGSVAMAVLCTSGCSVLVLRQSSRGQNQLEQSLEGGDTSAANEQAPGLERVSAVKSRSRRSAG